MNTENQSFDTQLGSLNAQISKLQAEIEKISKAKADAEKAAKVKADYNSNKDHRKDTLIRHSVELEDIKLEMIDGIYFIIGKDDSFEYVLRLTTDQAAVLADDLDDELSSELQSKIDNFDMVKDMFAPLFQNLI